MKKIANKPREIGQLDNFFLRQLVAELPGWAKSDETAIQRHVVAKMEMRNTRASAEILPQLVAEIPWGHPCLFIDKLAARPERGVK